MELSELPLSKLSQMLLSQKISSREVLDSFLKNIEKKEKKIRSFVTPTFDLAREMADSADSRLQSNKPLSPLDGIPITLKDVISTKGIRTTASSKILENYVPPFDATVWKKLKNSGVVLLGKVNTDEFTMGSSTETSAFGVTKNPHDLSCVSGGSSGGSAASVAADFCSASIGTDTGGSIRQPAHFCGVAGLKVSYGRVSRYGVIPMASSLDTIGPLAKTVEDCALIMEQIAGQDPLDSTTSPLGVPSYSREIKNSLSGLRIGIPKEYLERNIHPDILKAFKSFQEVLKDKGCQLIDISLPHTKYAISAYYIIAPAEISANMARFDGLRFGKAFKGKNLSEIYEFSRGEFLGTEVKRRILTGIHVLSAGYTDQFYLKAQKIRTLLVSDFKKAFSVVDAIISPVSPTPAFKIGSKSDVLDMYMEDILLTPVNLAGIPALSFPFAKTEDGLPIGMQIIGDSFQEDIILRIGHQVEISL